MKIRDGWKVLTHDGRPPLQGGASLLTGPLPLTLPTVPLDTGPNACAPGWHYCERPETALRCAGLWPDGRPSRLFAVRASADALTRQDKCRASTVTLVREATAADWAAALRALSVPFAPHVDVMVAEQLAWRAALARPEWHVPTVQRGLIVALEALGLSWALHRYETDAWAARDAWDAWNARDARDAWDARNAWDAWAARAAVIVQYVRRMGWQAGNPAQWTVGIRDAYAAGLAIALPVGPTTLGWAMTARP